MRTLLIAVAAKVTPHDRRRDETMPPNERRHMIQISQQTGGPRDGDAPPQARIQCDGRRGRKNQMVARMHGQVCPTNSAALNDESFRASCLENSVMYLLNKPEPLWPVSDRATGGPVGDRPQPRNIWQQSSPSSVPD